MIYDYKTLDPSDLIGTAKRKEIEKRAKELRQNPSPLEKKMSKRLNKLGVRFKTQVPIGVYIVDFLIDGKIIIEVDGKTHVKTKDYDRRRDNFLRKFGYKVIRLWGSNIDSFYMESNIPKVEKKKERLSEVYARQSHYLDSRLDYLLSLPD